MTAKNDKDDRVDYSENPKGHSVAFEPTNDSKDEKSDSQSPSLPFPSEE
ncbi:hypothetical protein ACIF2R_01520 [Serratia marcescens]